MAGSGTEEKWFSWQKIWDMARDMASYPLQLFRTLLGFRNILTKNSVQSAILVL
jgi:hypothetical protein